MNRSSGHSPGVTPPAPPAPAAAPGRRFQFDRDTFSFANELYWEYKVDAATGQVSISINPVPHPYANRCFVMVRSARQFFYHARFEPGQPAAEEPVYRRLVRAVIARDPRRPSAEQARILFPGYDSLRQFSRAWERLLKAECGGLWKSYFVRSHWRMVFPISRRHQERMAGQLVRSFAQRAAPIVHLFRFPRVTINHGIVLFDFAETPSGLTFAAYDPNVPDRPASLLYDRAGRTFSFPRNHYWAGGRVEVVEAYRGGLY